MEPVFLLVLSLLLATARAETKEAVLDTDGNALQQGRQYHVLPSIWARGGGLRMSRLNGSCPPNVVQSFSEVQNGEPLMFFPEEPSEDGGVDVRVSQLVYILFPRPSRCPQSTMWRRDNGGYITTGGTASSIMGPHYSRFAIVKSSTALPSYIIQSCPCRACRIACSTVVVNDVNGKRLLTVGSEANGHEVVFVRVRDVGSANILPATLLAED